MVNVPYLGERKSILDNTLKVSKFIFVEVLFCLLVLLGQYFKLKGYQQFPIYCVPINEKCVRLTLRYETYEGFPQWGQFFQNNF